MIFCSLVLSLFAGKYTDLFEREARGGCKNLICAPINKGGQNQNYTYTGSVKVGSSYGPYGTTTHYEDRQMTGSYRTPDNYLCKNCGKHVYFVSGPTVVFKNDGETRVMQVGDCFTSPPCFKAPNVYVPESEKEMIRLLTQIWRGANTSNNWVTTLESMWAAAKKLDKNEDEDQGYQTGNTKVEQSCPCSIQ